MLSNGPFYFGTLRKIFVAFGSLFSNIQIVRQDNNGNAVQTIKVPLSYGPKEKFLVRLRQDPMPNTNDQVEMVLPRCSYEMRAMVYDDHRKVPATGYTVAKSPTNNRSQLFQYNPVPYNITFELNVMTKTIEDGLQIIEQILPFFTPDYTVRVNDVPQLNLEKDISFVFSGITGEDTYEGDFKDRRTITFTLMFVAKAYIYPPVNSGKIILKAMTNVRLIDDPTTDGTQTSEIVSTGTSTIDPLTAQPSDAYTVINTIQNETA